MVTPVRTSKRASLHAVDAGAVAERWRCSPRPSSGSLSVPSRPPRRRTGRRRWDSNAARRRHDGLRTARLGRAVDLRRSTPRASTGSWDVHDHGDGRARPSADQGAVDLAGPARLVPGDRPPRHDRQRQRRRPPSSTTGPAICCTTPSNGFLYGGVATFDVARRTTTTASGSAGSNGDFNNFLRGTFTLSTKPYLDATIGTDNRQWLGADDLSPARAGGTPRYARRAGRGPLVQVPGRARPAGHGRPQPPRRGLRPGALRRHRRRVRRG